MNNQDVTAGKARLLFVDLAFVDDTIIYELRPVEVTRIKQATLREVEQALDSLGATEVIVDSGYPEQLNALKMRFRQVVGIRYNPRRLSDD